MPPAPARPCAQKPAVEVRRDAVERPWRRVALVPAHHQPTRLAAEVDEERRIAEGRHFERDACGARDEVFVRHRNDRDVHAREPPDLAGEDAPCIDDDLRLDRALVRFDTRRASLLDADSRNARLRRDLGSAAPRALGQREGHLAGIDIAVRREVGSAEDAVGRHRGEQLLRLPRRDQIERETERLRPAGLTGELFHPFLGRGPPQRERAAQLADETSRVEGRAAGQIGSLDEDDVAPAEPRQPVEDRAAADAATNDNSTRARPHRANLSGPGPGVIFGGWYLLRARNWFKGPIRQGRRRSSSGSRRSTVRLLWRPAPAPAS